MSHRAFLLLTLALMYVYGCGGDKPTGSQPEPRPAGGIISGTVTATDGRGGIQDALLELSESSSVLQETYSNVDGEFSFNRVDAGDYEVSLTLPKGYEKSGSGSKAVNVDGNINIDFQGKPIQEQTTTIQKGSQDTVFTGSGAFISVDASNTTADIEVTISENVESNLAEDSETKPIRVWIRPPGTSKSSQSPAKRLAKSVRNNAVASTNITIGQKISTTNTFSSGAAWFFDVGTEEEPLRLYAKANAGTYVDSTTGKENQYFSHTFESPHDADIELAMGLSHYWDEKCNDDLRTLDAMPGDETGEKALILIHGLHPKKGNCEDFEDNNPLDLADGDTEEYFDSLVKKLLESPEINDYYKIYTYRYPTNTHVITASRTLWQRMQQKEIERPVLLGHSMGGLVGRALMQDKGNDKVAGLITLGTPHQGSVIANLASNPEDFKEELEPLDCSSKVANLLKYKNIGISVLPIKNTSGLADLKIYSPLIDRLKVAKADPRRVFTIGGRINSLNDISANIGKASLYKLANCFMSKSRGVQNDGMVPLSSAIPDWTGLQTVLEGHDHSEMVEGNYIGSTFSNSVSSQIIPTLSVLAKCEPPPERVELNDFNLSGSVARTSGQEVQVTLNSISIDGEIVTDLNADNITVIENGCIRPISNFSTDNVGVDIVFAQDMSGSMDNAISGVRSSVTEFASDLSNRGINVQIGSIGYSGPGEIPSTPGPSPCEFIGPIQDLTDPNFFRDHVSNQWVATGGCDAPENALESIEYAQQEISWREGASRVFINITDASHHTNNTNCNDLGSCTDQSLSSLSTMVGDNSVIHAVADDSEYDRTSEGGADPWKLASQTGGENLVLPYNGDVDLTTIGITDVIGEASRFTFKSASPQEAIHTLRIRVEIDGKVAELAPDLVRYKRLNSTLHN